MNLDSRSRNPMGRKIPFDRFSYRANPCRRDLHLTFSQSNTCKKCKRLGHFARDCPHVSICHNCGLPGHIVSECSTKSMCWNCREQGHMANSCTNEGICYSRGIAGHQTKDCTARQLPPGDLRLCNNCYKQGHFTADFTNEKSCNGCRKTGVHASMVGSLHPTPVATLPFLSPHSTVVAFCEGILKYGTAWEALREELAAQQVTMTLDEVRERMRTVLSLTDVTRFPIPKTPNVVIFVAATDDGYIRKHSVLEL